MIVSKEKRKFLHSPASKISTKSNTVPTSVPPDYQISFDLVDKNLVYGLNINIYCKLYWFTD